MFLNRNITATVYIFNENKVCAQFLRGYVDIPLFKDVQPENIEDVTERYVHMFTEERDADIVKKVNLANATVPFFVISLIEHKSQVDYNVVMQMFRYMTFIWEDYEKEMERQHEGCATGGSGSFYKADKGEAYGRTVYTF